MSAEFVDTNVLIYAHDFSAGRKQATAADLLLRLADRNCGALSIQVLSEFYSITTRKLRLSSRRADELIAGFAGWTIHGSGYSDLLQASRLHQEHGVSWWDALIVNSAMELGCTTLWTEDLQHGQQFGAVTVRNPFLAA
jgi:predicted nucleic acid-binding protein